MNELQIFNYRQNDFRTIEKDGEVWFVAKDVCDILDLSNATMAVDRLEDDEVAKFNLGSQVGITNIINESGLYSLILGSRKPEAKQFKKWITSEVIPSIRKHGAYSLKPMSQAELTAAIAQNQVEIERKTNIALEMAETAQKTIDNALNIFTAPIEKDWRQAMNDRIRGMCLDYGLNYRTFYGDLYKELEQVAHINLDIRLSNLQKRLLKAGQTKTYCNLIPKLEVIERDDGFRAMFEGIVRKYQAKYQKVS